MDINSYTDDSVSNRQQKVYLRTYQRNIPSQQLQPYLDARPTMTKYAFLPIIDSRKQVETPLIQQSTYNINTTFNPGNDKAPWSGYASNVNHESELRNQIYALQDCSQSKYVPSSDSSLYQVKWTNKTKVEQPFKTLFQTPNFAPINPNPNPDKIGFALFNNATRQQLKDLTK
jgi:flagellar basal body rod protein FlgC